MDDQFFLVIRRGATLQRRLAIWNRQSKKSPKMKLMVHYAGEDGIDTGAVTKEYLSETISNISSCISRRSSNRFYAVCAQWLF